jgi:guanylate kinase
MILLLILLGLVALLAAVMVCEARDLEQRRKKAIVVCVVGAEGSGRSRLVDTLYYLFPERYYQPNVTTTQPQYSDYRYRFVTDAVFEEKRAACELIEYQPDHKVRWRYGVAICDLKDPTNRGRHALLACSNSVRKQLQSAGVVISTVWVRGPREEEAVLDRLALKTPLASEDDLRARLHHARRDHDELQELYDMERITVFKNDRNREWSRARINQLNDKLVCDPNYSFWKDFNDAVAD